MLCCATHLEVVCLVVASSAGVLKLEHGFELILLLLVVVGEDGAVVEALQCGYCVMMGATGLWLWLLSNWPRPTF